MDGLTPEKWDRAAVLCFLSLAAYSVVGPKLGQSGYPRYRLPAVTISMPSLSFYAGVH